MNALVRFHRRIDALQRNRWFKIVISAMIALAHIGLAIVVFVQKPDDMPVLLSHDRPDVALTTIGVSLGWWMLVVWLGLFLTLFGIAILAGVVGWVVLLLGSPGVALAVMGFAVLSFTFMLLIRALLVVFNRPNQMLSIAHTAIKESVRLRVSVVFIVLLLALLPIVPLVVQTDQSLQYRVQAFIQYSMGLTFYLAAFMTIFFACATVAFEIRDRQIWQLMTKPVSRFSYLLGKWLGIVSVNLVLLVVTGVSIFMFVQYLRQQPAADREDRIAVDRDVLVARAARRPTFERIPPEDLKRRIDETIDRDLMLSNDIEKGIRTLSEVERELAKRLTEEHALRQRTIDPGVMKQYRFEGLSGAKEYGEFMQLRFRIHYYDESTHRREPITFMFFEDTIARWGPIVREYVPTISQILDVPVEWIGDDGVLIVGVVNGYITADGQPRPGPTTPHSLNLDAADFEILYAVGGFEANYLRAMLVTWIKLAFIAMFGLAAATTLSFPVAVMMTFTVFLAAVIGPFLQMSLEVFEVNTAWRVDQWFIKAVALVMVFLFEPFGTINPTQRLVEGRVIEWMSVVRAMALLGVVWTGITLGLGYLAFRDRELATYSGHG